MYGPYPRSIIVTLCFGFVLAVAATLMVNMGPGQDTYMDKASDRTSPVVVVHGRKL